MRNVSHEQHEKRERVYYNYFSSNSVRVTHTERQCSFSSVRSLSEISRKSDSRAYFLTFARAKQRETRLCEKKELYTKKNEKNVVFCKEEFCFCWCLVVVDILQ